MAVNDQRINVRRSSDVALKAILERMEEFHEWRESANARLNMIDFHVKDLKEGQHAIVASVNRLSASMETNNTMTSNIQAVITSSKLFGTFLKWLAAIFVSGGVILAAFKTGLVDLIHETDEKTPSAVVKPK